MKHIYTVSPLLHVSVLYRRWCIVPRADTGRLRLPMAHTTDRTIDPCDQPTRDRDPVYTEFIVLNSAVFVNAKSLKPNIQTGNAIPVLLWTDIVWEYVCLQLYYHVTTLCLEKVHAFYFCDYSVKHRSISITFCNMSAEKICNQMTYSFLVIYSLRMNII